MKISVNGEARNYEEGLEVTNIVDDLGLAGKRIAIELNKEILPHTQYNQKLQDNDQIEIVQAIGGGQGDSFTLAGQAFFLTLTGWHRKI